MSPDTREVLHEVTLGEVYRSLGEVKEELAKLRDCLVTVRITAEVQQPKIRRLENIVYGACAVAGSALIASLLSLILGSP